MILFLFVVTISESSSASGSSSSLSKRTARFEEKVTPSVTLSTPDSKGKFYFYKILRVFGGIYVSEYIILSITSLEDQNLFTESREASDTLGTNRGITRKKKPKRRSTGVVDAKLLDVSVIFF